MEDPPLQDLCWSRVLRAVEKVAERRQRAVAALKAANIPYAIVGGHAVAAWVARIDEAATRTTPDVDLLVNCCDLDRVAQSLEEVGFVHQQSNDAHVLVDGPNGKLREGIQLYFAGERVSAADPTPTPAVEESEPTEAFQLINLDALVRMKLNVFRLKDKVHLLDMLDVGLIDASWLAKLHPVLGERLQQLIDNPD